MRYEGLIIRPPSEADSILLQVTIGCSHNKCTFCRAYKEKKFRIRSIEEIQEDLREAATYNSSRLFLCDGDALIIPQDRLVRILESIRQHLPQVERIGTYANAKSVLKKSAGELKQLRDLGLQIIYFGIESGNNKVLQDVKKGVTYEKMVEAGRRIKESGITLSATILLGIAGADGRDHGLDTAKILTEIDPDYVGALTIMVMPGTPLYEKSLRGEFSLPSVFEIIGELKTIIEHSEFSNCFFTSNHASNYLSIRARLPEQKERILAAITGILESQDKKHLRPEYFRAL